MSGVTINVQDLELWPLDRLGWLATYNDVRRVDEHLRWNTGLRIVISGPQGTAGGGWAPNSHYPGITKEATHG